MNEAGTWRPCNLCKKPIAYRATYWVCSVSTCNRLRTRLHFCSVECWDAHLPGARHRDAWAEEQTAPSGRPSEAPREHSGDPPRGLQRATAPKLRGAAAADDVLIVASRLKQYIRTQSGMNTSDRVLGPLSDVVRRLCDDAIASARRAERTTVLERDVPPGTDRRPAWLQR